MDGTVGAGMILRDDTSKVTFSACLQFLNCDDPLEAEVRRLTLQWSDKPMIVELDCSVLIGAIKKTNSDRSSLHTSFRDQSLIIDGSLS